MTAGQYWLSVEEIFHAGPLSDTLATEMLNFRVKIDPPTAHDSYSSWREADHDDLVLAVALACWWGEKMSGVREGLYSTVCKFNGVKPLTVKDSDFSRPIEKLADLCNRLLHEKEIQQQFDAILIDEGQELVVDDSLKFGINSLSIGLHIRHCVQLICYIRNKDA